MMNSSWYFDNVDKLPKDKRVAFKRACGKTVSELDAGTLVTLYKMIPDSVEEYDINKWLFATCICCLWDSDENEKTSVDTALLRLKASDNNSLSDSFMKRIYTLMDTEWDNNGFMAEKYLKIVKMLKQKGFVIDAASVLEDILYWDDYKRPIQKRWARTLSGIEKNKEEE